MRISTDRFESADSYNRLSGVLVVGIDTLEGYPLLSPAACRVVRSLQSPRRVVR